MGTQLYFNPNVFYSRQIILPELGRRGQDMHACIEQAWQSFHVLPSVARAH